jgi:hypothetical protein
MGINQVISQYPMTYAGGGHYKRGVHPQYRQDPQRWRVTSFASTDGCTEACVLASVSLNPRSRILLDRR